MKKETIKKKKKETMNLKENRKQRCSLDSFERGEAEMGDGIIVVSKVKGVSFKSQVSPLFPLLFCTCSNSIFNETKPWGAQ